MKPYPTGDRELREWDRLCEAEGQAFADRLEEWQARLDAMSDEEFAEYEKRCVEAAKVYREMDADLLYVPPYVGGPFVGRR